MLGPSVLGMHTCLPPEQPHPQFITVGCFANLTGQRNAGHQPSSSPWPGAQTHESTVEKEFCMSLVAHRTLTTDRGRSVGQDIHGVVLPRAENVHR